ncbi:aromatic prenyltransferase, partial [Chaetomidium leptoderma]
HAAMWNMRLGEQLSRLMQMAGYSKDSQAIHRAFFAHNVAPALGPCPDGTTTTAQWPSFMTDDHSPVEFSWAWSEKRPTPSVRYSAEPIGWLAGSDADPLNTKAAVGLLGRTLPLAPSLDLHWYRHFLGATTTNTPSRLHDPLSQTFIAFDLEHDGMVVKYYFVPTLKALSLGKSNLELAEDAILALPSPPNTKNATGFEVPLRAVTDFIRSHPEPLQPAVEIVAVDCVDPAQSRIKIYVRSRETTFASVVHMLTLGGSLPPLSARVRASLEELWCAVFGVEDCRQDLAGTNHRTAGMLYYYELKAGGAKVGAKVYLPVRHYAKSDDQIARGLSGYLAKRGKGLEGGMSYYDGVAALCSRKRTGLGFHTYITCAVKGDELNINAYFNPQVYCS